MVRRFLRASDGRKEGGRDVVIKRGRSFLRRCFGPGSASDC